MLTLAFRQNMKKDSELSAIMASNLEVMQASARTRDKKIKQTVASSEAEANKDFFTINSSTSEKLLIGDHDEEQRMASRVGEIQENATNGAQRIDSAAISQTAQAIADLPQADSAAKMLPNGQPMPRTTSRNKSMRKGSVAAALGEGPVE